MQASIRQKDKKLLAEIVLHPRLHGHWLGDPNLHKKITMACITIPHKYLLGNQEIWLVKLSWRAWL